MSSHRRTRELDWAVITMIVFALALAMPATYWFCRALYFLLFGHP